MAPPPSPLRGNRSGFIFLLVDRAPDAGIRVQLLPDGLLGMNVSGEERNSYQVLTMEAGSYRTGMQEVYLPRPGMTVRK